ncbi:hypothetical protein, partial [Staphylococcus aureus]
NHSHSATVNQESPINQMRDFDFWRKSEQTENLHNVKTPQRKARGSNPQPSGCEASLAVTVFIHFYNSIIKLKQVFLAAVRP